MRTPLNPALLLATSLADDQTLPASVRADMDVIAKGIALQARLVDDLLDITRISGGKLRLDLRPIDAHAALRHAYEILRAEIREQGIRVTLDLTAPRHTITADAVRLQQIFWNVLKNAVKFTPDGGSVTVRTCNPSADPSAFEVEISDTGVGIAAEMLPLVFDAFIQEEHEQGHRFGGVGLGLAITHKLVELQSGRIEARSDGRGQGSTFRIALPLENSEATIEDGPAKNALASAAVARHILLVEDHEQTRVTLARLLQKRGHFVLGVGSRQAALESAAAGAFDLVISDLGLPDGDGHGLMAELSQQYGLPGIALSGYGMEQDIARSRESGFCAHLTKPVDIRALESAMASAPGPIPSPEGSQENGAHLR